jgi:hypothetical protein
VLISIREDASQLYYSILTNNPERSLISFSTGLSRGSGFPRPFYPPDKLR